MRVPRSCWCCLFLCGHISTVDAAPLPVPDLNPLLSGYDLPPALPSDAADNSRLAFEFAVGNISLDQHSSREALQLDAELQRWQFSFARPLSDTLDLRIELPYLRVSGGNLDSFIESFHDTLGLPNGNRDLWPAKRLWIQQVRHGQSDYGLSDQQHGIGDLTVRLGQQLWTHPRAHHRAWLSLKLPTGDADKLTGSGAMDVSLSLAASQKLGLHFTGQQQISLSLLGDGERLTDQQETWVWSGSMGVTTSLMSHWHVTLQLDGHSQVLDSGLRALGSALQLSIGPGYESRLWSSTLLISEDIAVDTAPDVQLQLQVTRKL